MTKLQNTKIPSNVNLEILKNALEKTYSEINPDKAYVKSKCNSFIRRIHYLIKNEEVPLKAINDMAYAMLDADAEVLLNSFLKLEAYKFQNPEEYI